MFRTERESIYAEFHTLICPEVYTISKSEGDMTTIEQHIVAEFKKLDASAQQRVIQALQGTYDVQHRFDFLAWQKKVQTIAMHITPGPSLDEMLDDIRDGNA
jgi:hypothetical protein